MKRTTGMLALALLLATTAGPAAAQVGRNQGLLNPNLASRDSLAALPGMTAALADAVIAGRPHLDMLSVNAALTGLTDEQRATLYTRMWVPLNLNTASREEILLVPGAGARMAHEFEEYRPYIALAQFRREIGKYVDEKELARLERYVTIR